MAPVNTKAVNTKAMECQHALRKVKPATMMNMVTRGICQGASQALSALPNPVALMLKYPQLVLALIPGASAAPSGRITAPSNSTRSPATHTPFTEAPGFQDTSEGLTRANDNPLPGASPLLASTAEAERPNPEAISSEFQEYLDDTHELLTHSGDSEFWDSFTRDFGDEEINSEESSPTEIEARKKRSVSQLLGYRHVMDNLNSLILSIDEDLVSTFSNVETTIDGFDETLSDVNGLIQRTITFIDAIDSRVNDLTLESRLLITKARGIIHNTQRKSNELFSNVNHLIVGVHNNSDSLFSNTNHLVVGVHNNSDSLFSNVNQLIVDVNNNSENMFSNVSQLMEGVDGYMGKFYNDSRRVLSDLNKVMDSASESLGIIGNVTNGISGQISETLEEMSGYVDGTLEEMSGYVNETLNDMSGYVDGTLEEMSGSVNEILEEMSGYIDETLKDLSGKINEELEEVSDLLKERLEDLGEILNLVKISMLGMSVLVPLIALTCTSLHCYKACKKTNKSQDQDRLPGTLSVILSGKEDTNYEDFKESENLLYQKEK